MKKEESRKPLFSSGEKGKRVTGRKVPQGSAAPPLLLVAHVHRPFCGGRTTYTHINNNALSPLYPETADIRLTTPLITEQQTMLACDLQCSWFSLPVGRLGGKAGGEGAAKGTQQASINKAKDAQPSPPAPPFSTYQGRIDGAGSVGIP